MIADLLNTLRRRREEVKPALPEGIEKSVPPDGVDYYATLNLEIFKQDGKWTVLNREWACQATQDEPEKALLMMWRYIFRSGAASMTLAEDNDEG